ncbi:MAG: ribosomal protein S18-alanine N-acetyltransferase [Oscillospiraceae bacterium]|nr:ribosomal protein S18-alanine N-acetyltransferase [Oscillospiraceae bacterium]
MRIKIRTAEPRHLDEITRIEHEHFPHPCWSRELIERKLCDPDTRFLVAEADGVVLGYAVLQRIPPEAELLNIAVDTPAQRQGLGRRMILQLMDEASGQGIETMYLEARASNAGALALYRSLGFEQTGRRRAYYQNPVEGAVLMMVTL